MSILQHIRQSGDIRALDLEQLDTLCGELRQEVLRVVSCNGGHLASNLGVVELTVALHNVFDPMEDRILFDVGHQSYVHKLLSGRLEAFGTLRKEGGLSGFPKPEESRADAFVAGHASSAVSTALGMARARTLRGEAYDVVAVMGDGALTGGLAYEGLNSVGQSKEPIILILNDNGIAINHTVGGMAKFLTRQRLRPGYYRLKKLYRKLMFRLPGGKTLFRLSQSAKNRLKSAIYSSTMFEEMGIRYLGPVDGHNIKELSYMLKVARDYREPVLLHVVTRKGKGYPPAEADPGLYHGVNPFDPAVGVIPSAKESYSTVFGQTLCALAEQDPRIVAITAAMEDGTGLAEFHRRFPQRFFDEGISEGHCVSMAAGMAKQGLKPVFAVYSTFLQRSYDMLLQDVALLGLGVVLAVDRAGLVGADGETHNGVFDVGYLTQIPGMTVYSPASFAELRDMLALAVKAPGPVAVRYPRGGEGSYRDGGADALKCLRRGDDVTLITYGSMTEEVLNAAERLARSGRQARVLKLGCIAPLPLEELQAAAAQSGPVFAVEDCVCAGSIGEKLASLLPGKAVYPLNLGAGFTRQGSVEQQRRRCGLDGEGIARRVLEILE